MEATDVAQGGVVRPASFCEGGMPAVGRALQAQAQLRERTRPGPRAYTPWTTPGTRHIRGSRSGPSEGGWQRLADKVLIYAMSVLRVVPRLYFWLAWGGRWSSTAVQTPKTVLNFNFDLWAVCF